MNEKFSVYQDLLDGGTERVCHLVEVDEAVRVARQLATSVGARIGTTSRVIICDGGDCLAWEWKFGEGVSDLTRAE